MKELLFLLMIGISLSIDAFSVSTCIGIQNLSLKKSIMISTIVGIFHFIMPILGVILSYQMKKLLIFNSDIILAIILILLSMQMFIEYFKPTKKEMSLNGLGIFFFAFGVSLDSFSIGIGLLAITKNLLLASTVFTICSFSFTLLGLTIGKYINTLFKRYSYLIGTIILFGLGILFLLDNL